MDVKDLKDYQGLPQPLATDAEIDIEINFSFAGSS